MGPRARDFILGEVFKVLDAAMKGALLADGAAGRGVGGTAARAAGAGSTDKGAGLGCFGIAAGTEAAVVRAVCRCLFNLYSSREGEEGTDPDMAAGGNGQVPRATSPVLLMDSLQSARQAAALSLTSHLLSRACVEMSALHALLSKLLTQQRRQNKQRPVITWEEDDMDALCAGAGAGVAEEGRELTIVDSGKPDEATKGVDRSAAAPGKHDKQPDAAGGCPSLLALLHVTPSLLCAAKAWLAAPSSTGKRGRDKSAARGASRGATARTATTDKRAQVALARIDEAHSQLRRLAELCGRCRAAGVDVAHASATEVVRAMLERSGAALQALAHADAPKRPRETKDAADDDGGSDGGEAERDAVLRAARQAPKKRLRSRNKVVDRWLGEEGGADSFADLEDFLV